MAKDSKAACENTILVDPARVRFQHSRIRPMFSGCGRSLTETLDAIRRGDILPADLPPIQVIVGPDNEPDGPWYYSLNNRRLWVLKRCRDERLLPADNLVRVRIRPPKNAAERARYTVEKCSLEAKIMRECGKSGTDAHAPDSRAKSCAFPNPLDKSDVQGPMGKSCDDDKDALNAI